MTDIALYFEEKRLFPPVSEVLTEVFKRYPQVSGFEEWNEYTTDRTMPVLCMGKLPEVLPISYVKTLSQKQILSNPAAITELDAAITNLLAPPIWEQVPYAVVDGISDEEERALGRVLVVDIETGGTVQSDLPEDWWLLSVAIYDGVHCYVFTEESLQADTLDNAREQLLHILQGNRKLIAHNMKFDFRALSKYLGAKIYGHLDTMLLHHSINPGAREHGLKPTAQKYLGAPDWEAGINVYKKNRKRGYEQIPREILYHYNAQDVIWTWRLYKYLERAAQGENRIAELAKREFRMGNFFQDVENKGMSVDLEQLDYLSEKYTAALVPIHDQLEDSAWPGFNPGSWQQVTKWFADRGVRLRSTDEKTLTRLKDKGVQPRIEEFIDTLLEYRGFIKLNGTYVEGIRKRLHYGNQIFPTFLVHGTNTGRLSSKNPNAQNMPRDKEIRKLFISRDPETRCMIGSDYSQAELRVAAALSGDETMLGLFQPGSPDFFDTLMPSAFPKEDISSWTPQQAKDKRAKLKATVYGLAYNRGAKAIAADLKMPVQEAQAIINNLFRRFPKWYDWRIWVEETAISTEHTLISPFGRYFQNEVVTDRGEQNIKNAGLAFLPQSTASDLCIDAAIATHKWVGRYDAWITATIHDQIVIDAPQKYADEIADRTRKEMQKAGQNYFNDVLLFDTDAKWGRSWAEL